MTTWEKVVQERKAWAAEKEARQRCRAAREALIDVSPENPNWKKLNAEYDLALDTLDVACGPYAIGEIGSQ
jgi:hypothetical protein